VLEALQSFSGAVVLISHDQQFLAALELQLYQLRSGRLMQYEGSVSDYVAELSAQVRRSQ